ncbi:SsgA family sporulation/cell division regulator [Kitasatospora camelliae]|uniref:SsgA family sporulation/cell division regulator n=1 Tax=Kitasatospora camelliae TaxID=3156397 RepID=A0AAU8JR22_9ACTN
MPMTAVHAMSVTFPESLLPDVPVEAELSFDTSLPYAACLSFAVADCGCLDGGARVCWYFSRELLNEGRHAPAGHGDVRVRPGTCGDLLIALKAPTGHAVLSTSTASVAAFLADSFALVPAGSESDHLDVDTALARILAGG